MYRFRRIIFWVHLIVAIPAVILLTSMCVTGVMLAFREEIIAFADRDALRVAPPTPDTLRLSISELEEKVAQLDPSMRPTSLTFPNNPNEAILASIRRGKFFYIDPYSGEIRQPGGQRTRAFMAGVMQWHRWLKLEGDNRAIGKYITGAGSLAFLLLVLTGVYIWIPNQFRWQRFRLALFFKRGLRKRGREWNLHNVFGIWFTPIFIIMILSALPISYQWANRLIFTLTGDPIPQRGGRPAIVMPELEITKPSDSARPMRRDALLAELKRQVPNWETITLTLGGRGQGDGRGQALGRSGGGGGGRRAEDAKQITPILVQVKETDRWPRFFSTQIALNPYTGEVLHKTNFSDYNTGQRIRLWARFLHTGEAFGWIGKLLVMLAGISGLFLIYTGIALMCRRFIGKNLKGHRHAPQSQPKEA